MALYPYIRPDRIHSISQFQFFSSFFALRGFIAHFLCSAAGNMIDKEKLRLYNGGAVSKGRALQQWGLANILHL